MKNIHKAAKDLGFNIEEYDDDEIYDEVNDRIESNGEEFIEAVEAVYDRNNKWEDDDWEEDDDKILEDLFDKIRSRKKKGSKWTEKDVLEYLKTKYNITGHRANGLMWTVQYSLK